MNLKIEYKVDAPLEWMRTYKVSVWLIYGLKKSLRKSKQTEQKSILSFEDLKGIFVFRRLHALRHLISISIIDI